MGLTIVRADEPTAEDYGTAKLLPAVAGDTVPADKRSDVTLLLHLKASAAPLATTVFREKLDTDPGGWSGVALGDRGGEGNSSGSNC